MVTITMLLAVVALFFPSGIKEQLRGYFINMPLALKFFVVCLVVFVLVQMRVADSQPFIYFQF